jgi:hypothetical protein
MPLFAKKKDTSVQAFVVAMLNQNCPALRDRLDGPRIEGRINLTKVVMVVPIEDGKLATARAFTATTKEFSSTGVAVVVDHPCGLDEAVLGFRWRGNFVWLRAKARHLHPMGGGFFQLGFRMTERVNLADYPELAKIVF